MQSAQARSLNRLATSLVPCPHRRALPRFRGIAAVATTLVAGALFSATARAQGSCVESFESPSLPAQWSGMGSHGVTSAALISAPWDGTRQLAITSGGIAWNGYLPGLSGFGVDLAAAAAFLGVPAATIEGINPGLTQYGSATRMVVTAEAGDVLSFRWDFFSFEAPGEPLFRDYGAVTITDGASVSRYMLADTTTSGAVTLGIFGAWHTGQRLFSHTFQSAGTFTVGISVYDVGDGLNESGLLVDAFDAPGIDSDGDGYADCNDGCPTDPLKVAPGACGCGVADVLATYFADLDGDGFGDTLAQQVAFTCFAPPAHVLQGGDCDDTNPLVYPGATEVLNAIDDDCDGSVDEGLAYASRVSVSSLGQESNGDSRAATVTDDGELVAFKSLGDNLVPWDSNGFGDIFIRHLPTGVTELVSVSTAGAAGNGESFHPAASADGRFVAFFTVASNLVAGDSNGRTDVLRRDRQTGVTELVSRSIVNGVGNGDSSYPSISRSGNLVAFQSSANNLVFNDGNGRADIFVRDINLGTTVIASVGSGGGQSNGDSGEASIAGDGRFVAFSSTATNLVSGDTNGSRDIFVRDLLAGTTIRVSTGPGGVQANEGSSRPSLSADGRYVAFDSAASNLVPGDTNGQTDVFVHDLQTGTTTRIAGGNGASLESSISADGMLVVFHSAASNLVAGDTNFVDDVFAWFRSTDQILRVSVPVSGGQAAGPSRSPTVASGGRVIAYRSDASNLVPGDFNALGDVFANVPTQLYFEDADGDLYGNPASSIAAATQPPGYCTNALDCDDANPAVNPGAAEACDGVDNDCNGIIDDGFLATYCTAGTTVHGCVPSIAGTGVPDSLATSGFEIGISNMPGQRFGAIFYGSYVLVTPWTPGSLSFKCVANPVQRMGNLNSGGTAGQCNGELRVDFNSWRAANPGALGSPFVPGQVLFAQGWFRDPGAPGSTNLSDALKFTICQ